MAPYKRFPSLAEAFLTYFDVDLVSTPTQEEQAERIRYRVYCEEFDYETASDFPDHRESDSFDAYSLQCVVTHKRTGRPAGCVRMIRASENNPLPLEQFCMGSVYVEYMEALVGDHERVCEISRLAVDPDFRKRRGEDHTRVGEFDALDFSHQERRTFSMIGIAALLAAFALADLSGREHIFAMMESNLCKLLRRSGILAIQSGDFVEYHGLRAPHYIATEMVVANTREDIQVLYRTIYDRLQSSLSAQQGSLNGRERVA